MTDILSSKYIFDLTAIQNVKNQQLELLLNNLCASGTDTDFYSHRQKIIL
jgi:hypothetical protein